MRSPVRSEPDAFRLAVAGALAVGAAILLGWLTDALVGAIFFAALCAVAVAAYLRAGVRDHGHELREAAHEPHRHGSSDGTRHVLVIANEALAGGELRERILQGDGDGRVEVDVLAPVLTSRLHQSTSDLDRELEEARARLRRSLSWAHAQGLQARGEVGDPSALVAIADELRDFGADEVIVVTRPRERESWQERQELARLREELDVPITHVELEGAS